jgi:hypothetical protein
MKSPLRRQRSKLIALGLLVIIAAGGGSALGALPPRNASFTGSGAVFYNNGPRWQRAQTAQISFTTSANRRRILGFHGTYTYYCGDGTAYVSAVYIVVTKRGAFRYDFNVPNHLPDGRLSGRAYVSIYGHFLHGGKRAQVNYLVDYVEPSGKSPITHRRIAHPYSPAKTEALGCASWVRGSARAR